MSAVPKTLLTPEQYLARERKAEFKSEFYRGEMFAMAGASRLHVTTRDNLAGELHAKLKGSGCRAYSIDLRVKVSSTGLYTYPDITIACGEPEFEDSHFDTLLNPVAIVEVLSDSTEAYDRGAKFDQYRQVTTLKEYVLVAQDRMQVNRYVRQPDGNWLMSEYNRPDQSLEFSTIGASVPLAEIYRDVPLSEGSIR